MNLGRRFALLGATLFFLTSLSAGWLFKYALDQFNQVWGRQLVERQALYDRHRTQSRLLQAAQEVKHMVEDPAIVALALHENNPVTLQRGLKTFETYRSLIANHTVFMAIAGTGNYYFDDAQGNWSSQLLRYRLQPTDVNDKWFYQAMGSTSPYQINVARDAHTGESRVWINMPIRHNRTVFGIAGTGLSLNEFLTFATHPTQKGITNFFVDDHLNIQLAENTRLIDYASITRSPGNHSTLAKVLGTDASRTLLSLINRVHGTTTPVADAMIRWNDRSYLMGVSELNDLGWYDVTLVDMKSLILAENIYRLLTLLVGAFIVVLGILGVALQIWVLRPINTLREATQSIVKGDYHEAPDAPIGAGEIADLSRSFRHMARFIEDSRRELEQKVRERTEELQRLTEIDKLTGLLNRRGLVERLDSELARLEREKSTLGLLMLDLDHFKQINDTYGHGAGDRALIQTARVLEHHKRPYDHVGRYGGEEFLMLLPGCDWADLETIGERIRAAIEALPLAWEDRTFKLTTSAGYYLVEEPERSETALNKADKALYAAKVDGRNRIRPFSR